MPVGVDVMHVGTTIQQHCWFYTASWATKRSYSFASTINLVTNTVWVNGTAEFKHISERRNKLQRIPLVMANEQGQAHADILDNGPQIAM